MDRVAKHAAAGLHAPEQDTPAAWFQELAEGKATSARRAALIASFGQISRSEMRALLAARVKADPDDAQRSAAVAILASHGDARELALLFAWCQPAANQRRPSMALTKEFQSALSTILERDSDTLQALPQLTRESSLALVQPVIGCLAQRVSEARLACLSSMLDSVPDARALLLAELGTMGRQLPHPIDSKVLDRVQFLLVSGSADTVLAECIVASGKLSSSQAVPALIELLSAKSTNHARLAHEALGSITRCHLPASKELWSDWYLEQQQWWKQRAPEQLSEIRHGSAAQASQALLELCKRRLYRHELSTPLSGGLQREEESLVVLTCAALGHLGSTSAVEALLTQLEATSPEIRRAAHQALCRITGAHLGESPADWRRAGW